MTTLSKMSARQLKKVLDETKAELQRREKLEKASQEIQALIKKYKVSVDDVYHVIAGRAPGSRVAGDPKTTTNRSRKSTKKQNSNAQKDVKGKKLASVKKASDKRAFVEKKYQNPVSKEGWSGRGRPPRWVTEICERENIDVIKFKSDDRFKC